MKPSPEISNTAHSSFSQAAENTGKQDLPAIGELVPSGSGERKLGTSGSEGVVTSGSQSGDLHEVSLNHLIQNQTDEIEVLAQLFKAQHSEHMQQQSKGLPRDLTDRLLIRAASQLQAKETFDSLRHHVMGVREQEKRKEKEKDGGHSGSWRCTDMSCTASFDEHHHLQPFPDGKRHIFFWDCCLSGDKNLKQCDMFDFE